ncbi:MAG: hypothetical protein AB7S68_12360 [Polyangiaceae bacterium]
MIRVKNIQAVMIALQCLAGSTALGCASATLPVAAGGAADPGATIREEQAPPNSLGADFDPFAAYPELRGGAGGGHAQHMRAQGSSGAPEAAPPAGGEMPPSADGETPASEEGKK